MKTKKNCMSHQKHVSCFYSSADKYVQYPLPHPLPPHHTYIQYIGSPPPPHITLTCIYCLWDPPTSHITLNVQSIQQLVNVCILIMILLFRMAYLTPEPGLRLVNGTPALLLPYWLSSGVHCHQLLQVVQSTVRHNEF